MSEHQIDRDQLASLAHHAPPSIDWGCPLLCIDVETTGLGFDAEITEVAAITLDRHLAEVARLHVLVEPSQHRQDQASEWVQTHTAWGRAGSPAAWRGMGAVSIERALTLLGRAIEAALLLGASVDDSGKERHTLGLLGQHYSFDVEAIALGWGGVPTDPSGARDWFIGERWSRYSLDTRHLCAPLYASGRLESRSLAALAKHLHIHHSPHCALSDASATAEAARQLLRLR